MNESETHYKNIGISSTNYSQQLEVIREDIIANTIQDPILVNKIVSSVYSQLNYEEDEPSMDFYGNETSTMCFEFRKEYREDFIAHLKADMDYYAALEKDTTKPKAYRRAMAKKVVSLTAMYEALSEYSIENCKACFDKSNGSVNVFAATHCLLQFPGEKYDLGVGSVVSAVFYDGISGNPEILAKLNATEDHDERNKIFVDNIEIVGVAYSGSQDIAQWAIVTDETPFMALMLSKPM